MTDRKTDTYQDEHGLKYVIAWLICLGFGVFALVFWVVVLVFYPSDWFTFAIVIVCLFGLGVITHKLRIEYTNLKKKKR